MRASTDERTTQALSRVGTWLRGKWLLERLIGIGGMASVYAAVHRSGVRGALKMLHPDLGASDARHRFLREGYLANAVQHEGVARVIDGDSTDEGATYLVMELLDGENLEKLASMRGGCLTIAEVTAIGVALLEVLAAAHDRGICHRDIKPENIFATRSGRIRVLDFGIAKMKQSSLEALSATTTGTVIGSPAFMSPEQALGRWKQVDARSDLYAVGATLFNLLSGQRVHPGETITEILVSAALVPVAPVRESCPAIPEALAAVLDRALSFERDQRFPDARSMRDALIAAAPKSTDAKSIGGRGSVATLFAPVEAPRTAVSAAPVATAHERPPETARLPSRRPGEPDWETMCPEEPQAIGTLHAALALVAAIALVLTAVLVLSWSTPAAPPGAPADNASDARSSARVKLLSDG